MESVSRKLKRMQKREPRPKAVVCSRYSKEDSGHKLGGHQVAGFVLRISLPESAAPRTIVCTKAVIVEKKKLQDDHINKQEGKWKKWKARFGFHWVQKRESSLVKRLDTMNHIVLDADASLSSSNNHHCTGACGAIFRFYGNKAFIMSGRADAVIRLPCSKIMLILQEGWGGGCVHLEHTHSGRYPSDFGVLVGSFWLRSTSAWMQWS